jgi:N-acetyl-gamma-glutamyl-phosphate reductase
MRTAVVGGSGYAGGELLRLLATHPKFKVAVIAAGSNAGELVTSVHPQLQSYAGVKFTPLNVDELNKCELVFLALPHGESAKIVKALNENIKVIDLGADFRLKNESQWKKYYNDSYAGSLPYGLPELADKKIYSGNKISNPGCYATAISLGVAPLTSIASIDTSDVVVVAASGTTGAGRSAKVNLLGSEVMNNLTSYKFGGVHQHTPEIEQQLSSIAGSDVKISFTPILAPMPRGILATITCKYSGSLSLDDVKRAFTEKYGNSPFVHLLEEGALPNTAAVNGSNHVHIQVALDSHASRVIVSVALDNLGKGAAGQAIQNANLLSGIEESSGLLQEGVK